jgi:homoserine dehydrogenase
VLIEATPTNIVDGEPGLTHIRTALGKGMHVITAAKGPLVLRFGELKALADQKGVSLKFSAATAAALPTVDVGEFCLAGAEILSIEGILNGTTNYILTRMHREGIDYEEALAAAQALGIAEPDPSLDVEGWDTASKLVIIANHLLGASLTLNDVEVSGITGVSRQMIEEAKAQSKVIKLIGRTDKEGRVVAGVAPRALGPEHPMANIHGAEKGLTFFTDSMDRVTVTGGKSDPKGAAAAMLKDLINIHLLPQCVSTRGERRERLDQDN